ncbi:MAG: hypothetical protein ACR2FG_07440 [Marmoricola sp.]
MAADVETTNRPRLWLSSTVAFVLAASVSTTLHEAMHAVAGLAFGQSVTLSSFSADTVRPMSSDHAAVMTAAGPVFSLLLGVVLILTGRQVGRGFGRLFVMWLGFISAQNFVGYLAITPFGAGDSGLFVDELDLPGAVVALFCALGVIGLLTLAWLFLRQETRYVVSAPELRQVGLYAWLAGTLVTVGRTGIEAVVNGTDSGTIAIVMAGAASCGVFAPMFSRAWQKVEVDKERLDLGMPTLGIVLAVLLVAVQIAVLAPEIRLG